jgi:hypothetical protein
VAINYHVLAITSSTSRDINTETKIHVHDKDYTRTLKVFAENYVRKFMRMRLTCTAWSCGAYCTAWEVDVPVSTSQHYLSRCVLHCVGTGCAGSLLPELSIRLQSLAPSVFIQYWVRAAVPAFAFMFMCFS